jgi:cholesterol oxidase
MTEHFDAVIIGSGFGGSVMAYRLADAGRRVCLLERGSAYPPGSFPRSPEALGRNVWAPDRGLYGLFDFWQFRGAAAIVSSGLGGGSLIYANVLIRKPEKWFVTEHPDGKYTPWPVTRAELDPHYDVAEKMLNAQRFPFQHAPYSHTRKTQALLEAGKRLGLPAELPLLAVTFSNDGKPPVPGERIEPIPPNLHNAERFTCRLCGECDLGCNYGSKNTLDYNYLSLAKQRGAELRTLSEAKTIRPRPQGGGYEIDYVRYDPEKKTATTVTLTAERVIVAAGTLGSVYFLLRNAVNLPGLSPRLGERFSTNGDLLSFVMGATTRTNGSVQGRPLNPDVGPVITATLHGRDELDADGVPGERGFYLQEAGYPSFVNWIVESANVGSSVRRDLRFAWRRLVAWLTNSPVSQLSAEISRLISDTGAISTTSMPLLGMGRDTPAGRMFLRKTRNKKLWLEIDWPTRPSANFFRRLTEASRSVAQALDAKRFVQSPLTQYFGDETTVHPLGGCSLGATREEGVVDSYGEVFGHPGLYVADGSVMPGPVGPNPSLTITALAERFAERMLNRP